MEGVFHIVVYKISNGIPCNLFSCLRYICPFMVFDMGQNG
jgi:hypothetical protein